MHNTYLTAALIGLAIVVWLLSGWLGREEPAPLRTLAEIKTETQAQRLDAGPQRVRARVINASTQVQNVVLRGKTESKRTVEVRAELSGRVTGRPVERGSQVAAGDLLCQLSVDDRQASLVEAREAVNQAQIEYDGSLRLKARGFQSETAIAQAKARLAAAQAELTRTELDMERIRIRAPFAAFVEDVHLEIGDYVTPGETCVTLVDLDPMLLTGRVAERNVHLLRLGQKVTGVFPDGRSVTGPISFIGQQSDPATRTYPVEVQIPNPSGELRSGITTELQIPVAEVTAQKVSPALFALDDEGNIGVRTISANNIVEFYPVQIVREDSDGVWVSGLPNVTTLITVGQELVVPGDQVEPYFEPAPEMPAAVPTSPPSAANPAQSDPKLARR